MVRLGPALGAVGLTALAMAGLAGAQSSPSTTAPIREAGRCAMYDSCGRKSTFGGELPCPDNELAREVSDPPPPPGEWSRVRPRRSRDRPSGGFDVGASQPLMITDLRRGANLRVNTGSLAE